MKKLVGILMLSMVLLLTSCSLLGGASVEKAEGLLDKGKYDEAVEMFQTMIDEDELNFDAWFALLDAQLDEEEFSDMDETLEELLNVIEDNYDEDDEEIDYEDIVDDFMKAAEDLMDEDEIGDWYDALALPYFDTSYLSWETFGVGDEIVLDYDQMYITDDVKLLYNLDGKTVKLSDQEYKDSIKLPDAEGEYELAMAAVNSLGMIGETVYAYITIAELMGAPEVDLEPGYHQGPVTVKVIDFVADGDLSYYFTLDGSDPKDNGEWMWEEGIYLDNGDYTLRLVVYDYNTGAYSQELAVDYEIENMMVVQSPTTIKIGYIVDGVDIFDTLFWMADTISTNEENLDVEIIEYTYSDTMYNDFASGVIDTVFTWNGNIPYYYADASSVDDILELSSLELFDGVIEGTTYMGSNYMAPVSVSASGLLFTNYGVDVETVSKITSIDELSTYFYYDEYVTYGMIFPYTASASFFPVYLGMGGSITASDNGSVTLDQNAIIDALYFLEDLIFYYGADSAGIDYATYAEALKYANAQFVFEGAYLYGTNDFSYSYYAAGNMPLYEGSTTIPFMYVDGLIPGKSIGTDSNKAAAFRLLYNYMSTDYDYYYYYSDIPNGLNGLPANLDMIDQYYYSYLMETLDYVSVLKGSKPYSPGFALAIDEAYDIIDGAVYGYLNGDDTVEASAQMIIDALK